MVAPAADATPDLSTSTLAAPAARNPAARARILIALRRIASILRDNTVCTRRTLEQKISDQGPPRMRVDPHLLSLALRELSVHRQSVVVYRHEATGAVPWFAMATTAEATVRARLDRLAPLYATISIGAFTGLIGDALEICVYNALLRQQAADPRYSFDGAFRLDQPQPDGRFLKIEPRPPVPGPLRASPDFIQHDPETGPLAIECKNYREWLYPRSALLKQLILTSVAASATPVLICRRIHFTTMHRFLKRAGIIAHQTYCQYYPPEHAERAAQAAHKRALGFSDIRATHVPDARMLKFFRTHLPAVAPRMAQRFARHRDLLIEYATPGSSLSLAHVYRALDDGDRDRASARQ